MPLYVSQIVAIVAEAKARGYNLHHLMQAFHKSIEIGTWMICESRNRFCMHEYSIERRIWLILFGHTDAKPFPGVNPLIEYNLKYQQLQEARQAYEDKGQELDNKLELIKKLSDEAMEIQDASIEKQRKMYKWVYRAITVDVVITGLYYGHLNGFNQHEEHTYLMQIRMAMRRIITRLGVGITQMQREHQEKLNALRKLKVEVDRLDVEISDKEAELERIRAEWKEVRATFYSVKKPQYGEQVRREVR